jgi:hypothetical protein
MDPLASRPADLGRRVLCSAAVLGFLTLDLSLELSEVSKDSSRQSFTVRIEGQTLRYAGPLGEGDRGQYEHGERTLTVTGEQVEELLAAVRRSWTAAHEEQASTEGLGNFAALGARLVVGDRTVEISVRGRTSEWGTAGERLGERSRTLVAQASSLAWAVKRLVDAAPGP